MNKILSDQKRRYIIFSNLVDSQRHRGLIVIIFIYEYFKICSCLADRDMFFGSNVSSYLYCLGSGSSFRQGPGSHSLDTRIPGDYPLTYFFIPENRH